MTFRELHLAIFRREPVDRVLWEPRLEHWLKVNRHQNTLPPAYADLSDLQVYDDLNCSVRGYRMFNPCLQIGYSEEVQITHEQTPDGTLTTTRTPLGTVTTFRKQAALSTAWTEFPLKTAADIPVIEYLLEHQQVAWDQQHYEQQNELLGDRAAPTMYLPRTNLQRLLVEYAGVETTHLLMHDHPAEMERLLETIDRTDDGIYEVICDCPVQIINFGDNVAGDLLSPRLIERWLLPVYQKRGAQLRAAGKFSHAHWDGAAKLLLPYCQATGLDGIEALTPLPQGDVTLEEIKAGLGEEMILLDGIPATHFMPQVSYQELADFTRRLIDIFAPNLVLGISDEISPPGDIEKVRLISEIVAEYQV